MLSHPLSAYWSVGAGTIIDADMGEHIQRQIADRPRLSRKRPVTLTPELIGRRLLEIIVYDKTCKIGATLALDDLVDTSEVGDWKMPDFKMACTYAASQGWLVIEGDSLILTTAGSAAA
jgi:hypothetical protein